MLIKTISAISCAALVAGAIAALPGFVPGVEAHSTMTVPAINTAAKGDRLDAKSYGTGCSKQGWPHFEVSCSVARRFFTCLSEQEKAHKVRVFPSAGKKFRDLVPGLLLPG